MNFKGNIFQVLIFFLLGFYLLASPMAVQERQTEKTSKVGYPHTSIKYRGVVVMDADGGGADELYCDFGSNGLWVYRGGWARLSSSDPDWIISFSRFGYDFLMVDFGTDGLWVWWLSGGSLPGQWIKVSNADPEFGFALNDDAEEDDEEVHLDFGGQGLWRFDFEDVGFPDFSFVKMNSSSPSSDSFKARIRSANSDAGVFDYEAGGLWRVYYTVTLPNIRWKKLNSSGPNDDNVSAQFISGGLEDLIVDFGTAGLWLYEDDTSWHKINNSEPEDLKEFKYSGSAIYDLLCSFNGISGLWHWHYPGTYPGTWIKISTSTPDTDGGFCEPYDPNNDTIEEVAVDFGTGGLWEYDHNAVSKWTKLNSYDAEFMVRCDLFADGNDTALVVDFGTEGLWVWDGLFRTWSKISSDSPDGVN